MFYNPCEDELNTDWMSKAKKQSNQSKQTKGEKDSYFELDCASCFTPLSYEAVKVKDKELKVKGEYSAKKVENLSMN